MSKITAVVVTFNEENNIRECLEGLRFTDEIIVIDSNSPDMTRKIASDFGAKVIDTHIMYPEEKKNMGIDIATGDWVFIVDADERVSGALSRGILNAVKRSVHAGYWVYRNNYFLGRLIKHCGWGNDKVIRLFKKNAGRYPSKKVHGVLRLEGTSGIIKDRLEHYSYRNISDYFRKVSTYTAWAAMDAGDEEVLWYEVISYPLFRFIKMYFIKQGFLDGFTGMALCLMASFSVFVKYLRIYKKDSKL